MPENQNKEYKERWHNEYLKWICGFANAQGGTLYIGIDDKGKVVGVDDYKKLMDDLPNKIRNSMGITSKVNLLESNTEKYIEIITPSYDVAVSYNSKYYFRSGSTNQELMGAALNGFLLKKSGQTWDDIIESRAKISDIDEVSLDAYLSTAETAGRLPSDTKSLKTEDILEKLRLLEDGKLKRAAIVLFGKDPGKFYPNIFVKIGRFGGKPEDIIFQEVIEGNLVTILKNVVEQLNNKFLIRLISFKGLQRIEKNQYPIEALREMLLNSLIHRYYPGSATHIRVYDNKITIWNDGELPQSISIETLKRTHASKPRNPILADVSFKGGYIDAWGRGTLKIIDVCKEYGLPEPLFEEIDGGFMVTLFNSITEGTIEGTIEGTTEGTIEGTIEGTDSFVSSMIDNAFNKSTSQRRKKLSILLISITNNEGKRVTDYKDLTNIKAKTLEGYISQLKEAGLIEFRGEANQTGGYYLTDKSKKE